MLLNEWNKSLGDKKQTRSKSNRASKVMISLGLNFFYKKMGGGNNPQKFIVRHIPGGSWTANSTDLGTLFQDLQVL